MAFLQYADYLGQITREELATLTEELHQLEPEPSETEEYDDDTPAPAPTVPPLPAVYNTREAAEQNAEEEAASYLRGRYDMEAAYTATGAARNRQLVMVLVDMAIWHLSPRASYNAVSEIREKRYNAAIKWLTLVQAGKSNPALPTYADSTPGTQPHRLYRWGSQPTRTHDF